MYSFIFIQIAKDFGCKQQTERGEGGGAGLSFLRDQTDPPGCPLKTEFLHKRFVFSVKLLQGATAQDSHTTPVLSSSLSFFFSVVANIPFLLLSATCLLSTCGPCPWQVKRILHHRSWVAALTIYPLILSFPPFSLILPPTFHSLSLSLSQYWVAGVKGGQKNLITVTVGLFWHCSWSCADTHRAVCWL